MKGKYYIISVKSGIKKVVKIESSWMALSTRAEGWGKWEDIGQRVHTSS